MMQVVSGTAQTKNLVLDTDTVVVGSGAGGSVVARVLAEAGERVIVLEEGPYIPALQHGAMRPSESLRYAWRGGGTTVAFGLGDTPSINITMGRLVGGSSALTGGVCFRLPPHILHTWKHARGIHAFTEETLAPYYEEVERNIHVEEVPIDMRSKSAQLFAEGAAKMGAPLQSIRRNTEGCHGCGRCNFGCPEAAKLSVDISYLPHAARAGAQIFSDCLVGRVLMKGDRAVGVQGEFGTTSPGGPRHRFTVHAKRVVISAGSAHTPLLLRRSGVHGISGQVGKNVTVHPAFRMIGRFDSLVQGWKGALQPVFSDAYEHERITLTGLYIPTAVLAATMPGVGSAHARRAADVDHLAIFGGMIHDEGGGTVHSNPLSREPVLTYRMAKEDRHTIPLLMRRMGDIFFAAGAKEVFLPVLGQDGLTADQFRAFPFESVRATQLECSSQHPLGSCRMGMTREHSVVDTYGKVWDTRGLYVADGSIVPTSLGVNPQLTIMTLATHIGHHLRDLRA